ncbi:hypothetical protein ACHAO5_000228 [Verticillium nonalfalfae]
MTATHTTQDYAAQTSPANPSPSSQSQHQQPPRGLSRVFRHPMLQQHLDTHPPLPRRARPTPPMSPTSSSLSAFCSPHPSPTTSTATSAGGSK